MMLTDQARSAKTLAEIQQANEAFFNWYQAYQKSIESQTPKKIILID
jgi:hypothetical protein